MFCIVYLRGGIVYVPTWASLDAGGYMTIDPVEVVSASDTIQLREAFQRCFARGNPMRAMPKTMADWPRVIEKYARVNSWRAFTKELSAWSIKEVDGTWQIQAQKGVGQGLKPDPNQKLTFPIGTTAEDAIDRMITMLQEKAGSQAK